MGQFPTSRSFMWICFIRCKTQEYICVCVQVSYNYLLTLNQPVVNLRSVPSVCCLTVGTWLPLLYFIHQKTLGLTLRAASNFNHACWFWFWVWTFFLSPNFYRLHCGYWDWCSSSFQITAGFSLAGLSQFPFSGLCQMVETGVFQHCRDPETHIKTDFGTALACWHQAPAMTLKSFWYENFCWTMFKGWIHASRMVKWITWISLLEIQSDRVYINALSFFISKVIKYPDKSVLEAVKSL